MQEQTITAAKLRKPRLAAIEYIRGISMMGVIGIHVGSQYLANTSANVNLVALFEVATRFSVPIFFFISAFGLFYNLDLSAPFHFQEFIKRRFKTVLIPYLVWSVFYLLHDGWLYGVGFPQPLHLLELLFFGNVKYQLYFLVILLWFYLLMPFWIKIVRNINTRFLAVLFLIQLLFNYWSSFNTDFSLFIYSLPDTSLLKPFLLYRLNYWVMHYVFIFVLGGWLAVHLDAFMTFMKNHRAGIVIFFGISIASLLGYYYQLIFQTGYTPLEAINTAHQLCPAGIFYTLAASLFFFTVFTYQKYPSIFNPLLHQLGKHSYFAYLAHPIAITYLSLLLQKSGHVMTASIAIIFYFATLILAIVAAICCRKIGNAFPWINALTIGVYQRKKEA